MKRKDLKINSALTSGLWLLVFCLCMLSYNDSYADSYSDFIDVRCIETLEHFSFYPVSIPDDDPETNGFYDAHQSASGSCALGNKQLVWEYKPFSTSNPQGYCGASNYGGALTLKIDGKTIMEAVPIGGDSDCYGSPIYKIEMNRHDDQLEAFIYSNSKELTEPMRIVFDDESSVPLNMEYIQKSIR